MLRLLSGLLPQTGCAAAVQVFSSELRVATASNALHFRHYASQPAPTSADTVRPLSFCTFNTDYEESLYCLGHAGYHQGADQRRVQGLGNKRMAGYKEPCRCPKLREVPRAPNHTDRHFACRLHRKLSPGCPSLPTVSLMRLSKQPRMHFPLGSALQSLTDSESCSSFNN